MKMHWLTPRKEAQVPVTFGTPWERGELDRKEQLTLTGASGKSYPVQQKTLAYWPDGSVKWMALEGVLDTSETSFEVAKGTPAKPAQPVCGTVADDGTVLIENDLVRLCIRPGGTLADHLERKGKEPLKLSLSALLEQQSGEDGDETRTSYRFDGRNDKATLEECGPVRAVVRIQGKHVGHGREILPFDVRLYVYAGSAEVRLVHSFILDIREKEELLHGIAVTAETAVRGELFNRHVGFTGDTGLFYEGVQCMFASAYYRSPEQKKNDPQPSDRYEEIYRKQLDEGQFVTLKRAEGDRFSAHVDDDAAWDRFLLNQDSCDHYSISKRTQKGCAMIQIVQGRRSQGTMFFGSEASITAIGIKDFWQKSPTALEISGGRGDTVRMTAWLYSKYGESYDFGPYDTVSHQYSYGGINNYPYGIANTNEIVFKLYDEMPGKQAIWDFAGDLQTDSLLVADPERYVKTKALGSYWAPATKGEAGDEGCENALSSMIRFYIDEVERRKWYGFWDYGDVMHSYDIVRHCWLYDTGGRAWQNTELCPTYVNWIVFLRTGDYDIYRFARAMSRHCSEVDTYHAGKYAMLGTRHNVRHWGCGAKEARISMAGHHRFYYYLTGDERVGDVMEYVKDVDLSTLNETGRDPMGGYFPPHPNFSHIRIGPDWSSFVSNWMTQWERFEDTKYRDKIMAGLETMKKAPLRLASGSTFHYNPQTGEMHYMGAPNPAGHTHLGDGNYQQHMVICFGGPETFFELSDILDDPEFTDMVAELASYYFMTPEERTEKSGGLFNDENMRAWNGQGFAPRMLAFDGYYTGNAEKVERAMNKMIPSREDPDCMAGRGGSPMFTPDGRANEDPVSPLDAPVPTVEVHSLTTNGVSQWALNYMEVAHFQQLLHDKNKEEQ